MSVSRLCVACSYDWSCSAALLHRLCGLKLPAPIVHVNEKPFRPTHLSWFEKFSLRALQQDLATSATVLEEFLSADTVVVGVGFYNFGIPSQLKAWVDRVAVAGKTFRYTQQGPEGLAGGKRVVFAIARGGVYSEGSPAATMEHGETYLRSLFAFMGITGPEVIAAEGVNVSPENRQRAIASAQTSIAELA